jgi:hypothetical protein
MVFVDDSDCAWCAGDPWRARQADGFWEAPRNNLFRGAPVARTTRDRAGNDPPGVGWQFLSRAKGAKPSSHLPWGKEVTAMKKTLVRIAALAGTLTALLAGGGANFKVH